MSSETRGYSLYLLDLDSTLTESISGKTFPQTVDDRKWMTGRLDRLRELQSQGKKTCIVTNQGGAAWGFLDPSDMHKFLGILCEHGKIDHYLVCFHDTGEKAHASERTNKALTVPDLTADGLERRKPGPGMLVEAMRYFSIPCSDTIMIGDREEDREAAKNALTSFRWAWDFFGESPVIV
jgi:D-glycero-D-manno-heptose 1,7-bisphosphate phosphatase